GRGGRVPVGAVPASAPAGDGLAAGAAPEGLVYRIGARGDTALLARTGERYVWGLAAAPGGAWYAATGTRGKLLRIAGKDTRVVLDSDESNLRALVSDGRGGGCVSGDSHGRGFHAIAEGGVRTVFDAGEDDVRSLALGEDGALYAAALSASAVAEEGDGGGERPAPVRSAVSGGRGTVYRIVPDSVTSAYWVSPPPFVFALAPSQDGVLPAPRHPAPPYPPPPAPRAPPLPPAPPRPLAPP